MLLTIHPILYNKLNSTHILIGSYELLEDRCIDDVTINNFSFIM